MAGQVRPEDQLWFFLKENMTLPSYVQKQFTLKDIQQKGLSLADCLKITNSLDTDLNKYAFYIYSASMAAAVRLLSDESILTTFNLYCQKDLVVTILIRAADDLSPNTSRAPSHQNSLAERRKVSRGRLVSEIFIQPKVRHASGSIDVNTMEPIADVAESEKVSITLGGGRFETFTKEYLLCWIISQLDDSKPLTDIVVQSLGPDGDMKRIALTAEVWQHSLIRGQWKDDFLLLWNDYNRVRGGRESILADLSRGIPNFTQSCQNFIHDLRTFGGNKKSRQRLDGTGHEFYLGPPYLNNETRERLLKIPTKSGTLETDLRQLAIKRSGGDICAAHDLSPLYEAILGVQWDKVKERGTAVHDQMSSLSLESQASKAKQIVKKSSQMLNKAFNRKGGRGNGRGGGGSGSGSRGSEALW